ncbi:PH domain-containing protein [Flavobacterium sp. CS20]|uniref:PH domain-containing protein n=1 Tax=Flavobacterium sp. CS20 TaxID=2775246 RepID=UPI001B39FE90|nr:PH domain-containing protein [Flavobacterium sp. CS20]QTY28253.1 PH domain-containing protein [Flavobacterium sp. CS20]
MINFQNQTLDLGDLPRFETVEGHPVDKAYLKVLRILYTFWFLLVFSGLFLSEYSIDLPSSIFYSIFGGLAILFLLIILNIELGFSRRKFGIREKDLIFQKGFFVFKQTIVPYKRIQHIEVKQGLVFKAFNLYTLKIYTAGSSTGDLSIAGLNRNDADKLKAQILKVADLDEN